LQSVSNCEVFTDKKLSTKNYQNNCEEEDEFNDYAPAGEMHPMYQVTRVSSIISSAAMCAQRKE